MPTVTKYPAASGDDFMWYTGGSTLNAAGAVLAVGPYGYSGNRSGIRFPSVSIPQGSAISSAVLTLYSYGSNSGTVCKVKIYGNDVDNAVAPTTHAEAQGLALTSASVSWSGIGAWTAGNGYDTPDLSAIIQEIVDRPGWSSGNALQIIIHDDGSSSGAYRTPHAWDGGNSSYYAKLVITYSQNTVVNVPAFSGQSSLSMQDVYLGRFVEAPPFAAQCGLNIDGFQIGLSADVLSSLPSLTANIQRQLPCPSFTGSSALQVFNICRDYLIEVPPLQGQPSLTGNTRISVPALLSAAAQLSTGFQIQVQCPSLAGSSALQIPDILRGCFFEIPPLQGEPSLAGNLHITLLPDALSSLMNLSMTGFQLQAPAVFISAGQLEANATIFIDRDFIITYLCVLSAPGLPDITLPMENFQARFRSGDPSFLSVVIPGMEHAGDIADRAGGTIKVYMIKTHRDGNRIAECIGAADMDDIRIDEGATNRSITLSGYKTETHEAKTVTLTGASYRMMYQGRKRYRCQPNLYVRPGDTVIVNGDTFQADVVTWAIGPGAEIMEVAEE